MTTATAKRESRMTLTSIRKGRRPAPDRVLLLGVEGVGKSTWGAAAGSPIFIAAEDGIRHLDASSFPEPESMQDVFDALRTLAGTEHDYKTLVIDTIDWLEPMVWEFVCKREGWFDKNGRPDIEKPGYGKGYVAALSEWRRFLSALDHLRHAKSMEIVLLAHVHIRTFANPAGEDYNRYEGKLNTKAYSLIKEWADTVLFATFEEVVTESKGFSKAKGYSTGRRVVHTNRTAAYDAKNRHGLPDELPLAYADYAAARSAQQPAKPADLVKEATSMLESAGLTSDQIAETRDYIQSKQGNATDLAQIVDRLRSKVAEQGGAS